ncbi:S-adenosyl-L-methionine-dependent tRNA 4-demethylwyosine synthase [Cyphellophora attinorum]|uniref:S-adenosyl-L-methionine-dependent tRNA 4-demethylwyosine synthase n=1 Tax=Cyphellophora attinorum TaxID=1664694 RepID=A0A0N0NLB9_9EURO|nr:S-adenosyl-L-methionine-dependent tRNA 4-demethylwyosine synthase [Phialophora attinorum]KPI39111.1 S-adenosyl-L-methionine-dependent tRNA 4-demethylwyosine synthase [Phialophora attinorum]
MDIGEGGVWPIIAADHIDRLFTLWHDHRVLVVPALCAVVAIVAYTLRRKKETVSRPTSPAAEEKADWIKHDARVGDAKESVRILSKKPTRQTAARVVSGRKPPTKTKSTSKSSETTIKPLIFYCSLTGTTERLSKEVLETLTTLGSTDTTIAQPEVHDLSYIELDDYFISGPRQSPKDKHVRYFYVLLVPSYDIDTIMTNFLAHLDETHNDFRIDTAPLSSLAGYSVFGVGDREGWPSEEQGFCSQAIEVDKWMAKLTQRKRAYPIGMGDVKSDVKEALASWCAGLSNTLAELATRGDLGEGVPGSGDAVESDVEEDADFPDNNRKKRQKVSASIDVEDVGGSARAPLAIDFTTSSQPATTSTTSTLKPMVPKSSPTYTALTKQGYTIIGTHSGVKICRWTKSALRARGSCYKNSFYGIAPTSAWKPPRPYPAATSASSAGATAPTPYPRLGDGKSIPRI